MEKMSMFDTTEHSSYWIKESVNWVKGMPKLFVADNLFINIDTTDCVCLYKIINDADYELILKSTLNITDNFSFLEAFELLPILYSSMSSDINLYSICTENYEVLLEWYSIAASKYDIKLTRMPGTIIDYSHNDDSIPTCLNMDVYKSSIDNAAKYVEFTRSMQISFMPNSYFFSDEKFIYCFINNTWFLVGGNINRPLISLPNIFALLVKMIRDNTIKVNFNSNKIDCSIKEVSNINYPVDSNILYNSKAFTLIDFNLLNSAYSILTEGDIININGINCVAIKVDIDVENKITYYYISKSKLEHGIVAEEMAESAIINLLDKSRNVPEVIGHVELKKLMSYAIK